MVGAILLIIGACNPREFTGDYFVGCGLLMLLEGGAELTFLLRMFGNV